MESESLVCPYSGTPLAGVLPESPNWSLPDQPDGKEMQGVFFTGLPQKMTKCQITRKSLQTLGSHPDPQCAEFRERFSKEQFLVPT